MEIELTKKEMELLEMFEESRKEPRKYYSNNLAHFGCLVEAIELTKRGLLERKTGEKNTAYFSISKQGVDYLSNLN